MNAAKRYKDIKLPFICPINSRAFESTTGLSIYVTKTLKIDYKEYYDKYINHRDSSCFFCGNKGKFISLGKGYRNLCENDVCIKKSFNSHSIEGFMYKNMCSRDEAEKLFNIENKRQLEERVKTQNKLRKEDPNWDRKRSRNCVEFWIEKGFTKEESELKTKEVMNEIHQKTSKKLKENPEKYASKYPTKIEYYLGKGFSKEEAGQKISEIQNRFSLKSCIEKYGSDGRKIWQKRQDKWMVTMDSKTDEEKIEINRKKLFNHSGYSKISQKLFWEIYKNFEKNIIKFEELNGEIIIYDKKNNQYYRYDYVDYTNKKVIEFNGDFWHCNPDKYNENFEHKIMKVSAKKIWEKDKNKISWMNKRGYKVLVIWESDYKKNPEQTLQKCIEFLYK